jgi:polyribonucleotide nucleotidyltransferase
MNYETRSNQRYRATSPAAKKISFETGKLAKQAHGGASVVRLGENVVLATATANA